MKKEILEHPRNEKISFDKEKHEYIYCGDRKFQGSTSWISQYTAPFDKQKIARKVARLRGTTPQAIIAQWDAARDYGDYVHENIETFINDNLEFSTPELTQFKAKLQELNLTPVISEWVVYDEDVERASAIDVVCLNEDDEIVIIDIKTRSKDISYTGYQDKMMKGALSDVPDSYYHKYALQVNIYKYWVETKYKLPVSPVNYVFRLREDFCEVIPVLDLKDKIQKMYNDET